MCHKKDPVKQIIQSNFKIPVDIKPSPPKFIHYPWDGKLFAVIVLTLYLSLLILWAFYDH